MAYPGPAIFFCFTNRSGSNFIADCFVTAGALEACGEYFNNNSIVRRAEKRGITSFPEFCRDLGDEMAGTSGVFGAKAGWHQLFFLWRTGIIPHVFPRAQFVFIRRRDILGQAISATIAFQTRKFRYTHPGNGLDAKYDFESILGHLRSVVAANASFEEFFALTGVPFHEIVYEDFVQEPEAVLRAACERLSLSCGRLRPDAVNARIQRNERNREFRSRFLEEVAARGLLGLEEAGSLRSFIRKLVAK